MTEFVRKPTRSCYILETQIISYLQMPDLEYMGEGRLDQSCSYDGYSRCPHEKMSYRIPTDSHLLDVLHI